jgi:two-component system sensor histidine kinase KdpD
VDIADVIFYDNDAFLLFLLPFTGYWTVALILLFVVTGLALFVGRGPVLISAGLSACLWNFLFIPPRFTFYIDKIEDGMMFIVYFFIATILGSLTNRLRTKESAIRLRESRIVSLYNFSQLLARSHTMKDIVKATVSFIDESLDAKCCIILKEKNENNNMTYIVKRLSRMGLIIMRIIKI